MNNVDLQNALKVGTLPVALVRHGKGWAWCLPKKITKDGGIDHDAGLSNVFLCNWGKDGKMASRFNLQSRYLAQVYADSEVGYIRLRWAMKLPNWGRFGALPELAQAMKRANLIP